jgi:hypothetical protein
MELITTIIVGILTVGLLLIIWGAYEEEKFESTHSEEQYCRAYYEDARMEIVPAKCVKYFVGTRGHMKYCTCSLCNTVPKLCGCGLAWGHKGKHVVVGSCKDILDRQIEEIRVIQRGYKKDNHCAYGIDDCKICTKVDKSVA